MSDEGEKESWLEPLPEEYATTDDTTGRRMIIAALTVIILAVFGGMVWYSYLDGTDNGPVPVVRADNSVIKEKPVTPGGLQVLDQDKRVFNRVAAVQSDNNEKLAPSAELPLERPVVSDPVAPVKANESLSEAPAKKTELSLDTENTPSDAVATVIATVPDKISASVVTSDGKIGDYLVQLGAFGKKNTAIELWQKLQKNNPELLAGLSSDIMKLDRRKKGAIYRLRGGMIVERATAINICTVLKKEKHVCIVVVK